MKSLLATLALLFTAVAWGAGFILAKWGATELGTSYFLFVRLLLASLVLTVVFYKKLLKIDKPSLLAGALMGLALSVGYLLQIEGIRLTTASNASMIAGLYMLFVPILSWIFFRTRISLLLVVSILLAFVGLLFLTGYSYEGFNLGDAFVLIGSVAHASHIILTGRYAPRYSTAILTVVQLWVVTGVCGLISASQGEFTLEMSSRAVVAIVITALFATAFAYLAQTWAQKAIEPARAGLIFSLESVFGLFFAWWLGGEWLTTMAWIGAILIFTGILLSEVPGLMRKVRRGRHSNVALK